MPIRTPGKQEELFNSHAFQQESPSMPPTMSINHHTETESVGESDSSVGESVSTNSGQRVYRWSKFVRNLYEMAASTHNAKAVGFSDDGLCLEIRDPKLLSSDVLQNYFKHKNVSSFIRQLNNYGFKTVPILMNSMIAHCFAHDYFQRGRLDMLEGVTRRSGTETAKLGDKLSGLKEKESQIIERMRQLKRSNEQLRRQNAELEEENKRLKTNWVAVQESLNKSRMFEQQNQQHQHQQHFQQHQQQQQYRRSSTHHQVSTDTMMQFPPETSSFDGLMMPGFPVLFPEEFQ